MIYVTEEALGRAALALEALAAGMALDRALAMEAALTLRTYADLQRDMEFLNVGAALETLASGGELPLDRAGRDRAAVLAARVRAAAARERHQ